MSKKSSSSKMVATKSKNSVLSCSTPEHRPESPSRDSDSICDSDAASPVPFLCTQDGAEGETDVVWNFYTPKSDNVASSRLKNSTPVSRKTKKPHKPKIVEKPLPKRRPLKPSQKKTELFQDLIELNQNLHELIAKNSKSTGLSEKKVQSGSEDDIFNDSGDCSPKRGLRTNSRCLRRNVLSSKFGKPDPETALESDDSMNECLIKASQVVEENILNHQPTCAKRTCYDNNKNELNPSVNIKMNQDSMDAILNSIKLESPVVNKAKKCDSPKLNNDSFDVFVENLNDSTLEQLTQMPIKNNTANKSTVNLSKDFMDWTVQDLVLNDESLFCKSVFGRHSSMPESPTVTELNRPSTSGMAFGRYSSMPIDQNDDKSTGDSPIRCTPEEIKKKHQQAREKLLAKRLFPSTSSQVPQQSQSSLPAQPTKKATKRIQFQPRTASTAVKIQNHVPVSGTPVTESLVSQDTRPISSSNAIDVKLLIEKKRQEALMKLRRRQPVQPVTKM